MKNHRMYSNIFKLIAKPARVCMCGALAASAWAWGLGCLRHRRNPLRRCR